MQVFGADEQTAAPVDVDRWVALARDVLVAEGVSGDAELSLLFVDEETIAELNDRFMDAEGPDRRAGLPHRRPGGRRPLARRRARPGPTATSPSPATCPSCSATSWCARRWPSARRPTHAGSYDDEMALLVVHGILHVLGHDHAEPEETAVMQARERELLDRFHHRR